MPDMTTEEVRMLLRVQGLAPLDATDLDEITHRINAINEAVAALESADADVIEPLPVFWLTQEEGFEVPGYAGTTEEEHPHPNLLPGREKGPASSSPAAGLRGSRLRGNDGGYAPVHPHPSLLPSREKGPEDLTLRPATELSALITSGELSPVELTEAFIARAKRFSRLNAYITLDEEGALRAARYAEAELARGAGRGPLHGLPVAVKDQFDAKGLRTTVGGNIVNYIAEEDATAVGRLREAGAVLLGKLNLSEYALGGNVQHPFGVPRNPWDETRQAGQSSSGSGVAIAASLCAASLGGDTAGSIRGPAGWCGIVGLRPTWGAVSRHGAFPMAWFMDTIGPMTKTVADAAMLFQAIAGHDPRDPYTSRRPVTPFEPLADLRGVRVGVIRESVDNGMSTAEVADAVDAAMRVLQEAGALIADASLPLFDRGGLIANTLSDVEAAHTHRRWLRERPRDYDFATRRRLMAASLVPATAYAKLTRFRTLMREHVMRELDRFDIIVTPAQPAGAPPIATETGLTSKEAVMGQFFGLRSHRSPFNLSGVPAMAVPCGFTSGGLPMSVQLAGRPFAENTLFRIGHAYQERTDWHERRPTLA